MISFVCKLDWRVGVSLLEEKRGKGSLIYMNTVKLQSPDVIVCHWMHDCRYTLLNGCTGVNSFLSSPSISFSCHISYPVVSLPRTPSHAPSRSSRSLWTFCSPCLCPPVMLSHITSLWITHSRQSYSTAVINPPLFFSLWFLVSADASQERPQTFWAIALWNLFWPESSVGSQPCPVMPLQLWSVIRVCWDTQRPSYLIFNLHQWVSLSQ